VTHITHLWEPYVLRTLIGEQRRPRPPLDPSIPVNFPPRSDKVLESELIGDASTPDRPDNLMIKTKANNLEVERKDNNMTPV